MNIFKILVACEESQAVTKEFRALGHQAFSCDIEPCSGGHPEWHIQEDVLPLLKENWDMIIAFPPCTYLSNAGAVHLYPNGKLNVNRYNKGVLARDFFMKFYNANAKRVAIENPLPSKIYKLPQHSQVIQPFQFGHPTTKRTHLWLRNLPHLIPTDIVVPTTNCKIAGNWFNCGGKDRQKNRAKTFPGIAKAMASQWSEYLNKEMLQ